MRPVEDARRYDDTNDQSSLPPDSEALVEIIDDAFAESALLVERATFSQRKLGEDQVFASAEANEFRITWKRSSYGAFSISTMAV